jgi:hypothetical protein
MEQDLEYVRQVVPELERYILSKEVYWPLPNAAKNGSPQNRLNLGELLLREKRLRADLAHSVNRKDAAGLLQQIDDLRSRWKSNWENKAVNEFPVQLRLWNNYLQDYFQDPEEYYRDYPREVKRRVILQLLLQQAPIPQDYQATLYHFDQRLKGKFDHQDFIWDKELMEVFPSIDFWFLYGVLRSS